MRGRVFVGLVIGLILAAAPPSLAAGKGLTLAGAWSPGGFAAGRPIAVYLNVVNDGDVADRLIAAASPVARRIEFHRSYEEGGVVRMAGVASIPAPAHETVTLAQQGLHLMLMGPATLIRPGDSFPLTLTFERAGPLTVTVVVRGPGQDPHAAHHGR